MAHVTSAADDGTGSSRNAVAEANTNPEVRTIDVRPGLETVHLQTALVFSRTRSLVILANGATLDGSALATDEITLLVDGGGDLEVVGLTVRDAPGHGLIVRIPRDASGTRRSVLRDMDALDNLGHSVEINDQVDPDDTGDSDNEIRGNSNGSDAALGFT